MVWVLDASDLPPVPGGYVLLIRLDTFAALPPRWPNERLKAGRYVYFGSANGPGGIRARCARHFRRQKKRHWHVDWLTVRAPSVRAAAFPNRSECSLAACALEISGVLVPVEGFGSSDCQKCPAHLLALSPGISADQFLGAIIVARR